MSRFHVGFEIELPLVPDRVLPRFNILLFPYRIGASMMGSTHTYDVPAAGGGARRIDPGGVEMALNPDEVDLMDTEAMQAKAEAALREQAASLAKEDFSGKKLAQSLFRNKRFALNKMFQRNASKFAIFYSLDCWPPASTLAQLTPS